MTMTDEVQKLLLALKRTRDGYEEERVFHRFLLDAYAGTGGFASRVRLPFSSYWGWSAEAYSRLSASMRTDAVLGGEAVVDTYLDRFAREDLPKFQRRSYNAQYPNYVEPILDIRLSYLNRKPFTYDGFGPLFESAIEGKPSWSDNVHDGMSWDRLMKDIVRLRASLLGWTPVLFDAPMAPEGASVAQTDELGIHVKAVPLFPANVLDYQCEPNSGCFTWVKLLTTYAERADALGESFTIDCYAIWEKNRARVWEFATDKDGNVQPRGFREVPHSWGQVPIVIFRSKPAASDPVKGHSVVGAVAQLNRKLFNYLSELDEILRNTTFPMLQVPIKDPNKVGTVVGGTTNALAVPPDSSRDFKWVQPDTNAASVYEKRIEVTMREIHRIGRTESSSTVDGGGTPQSGISQAYDFENTNRAISDTARSFAASEQEGLKLVAKLEAPTLDPDEGRVVSPTRFDVEAMSAELADALSVVKIDLGPTATSIMKQRLARTLLPNLDEDDLAVIDQEIEDESKASAQQSADARMALSLAGGQQPMNDVPKETVGKPDPTKDEAGTQTGE